jgi:hypothetical protein
MSFSNATTVSLLLASSVIIGEIKAESDLSLWETGGMYFCVPYAKGTVESDLNVWHEDGVPGYSLYGSYAFSDKFTLKLETPFEFQTSPYLQGFKATGLYGMQSKTGDRTLSIDGNFEYRIGEDWKELIPSIGCNAAKRWGRFAMLARISGGVSLYSDSSGSSTGGVCEIEAAPFMYTGDLGMVGSPLMFEYSYGETSVNLALDWELYLPGGISLWVVPRYEVVGGSGFSVWTGIAWMRIPE